MKCKHYKNLAILIFASAYILFFSVNASAQKLEIFDIISFKTPKGWQKEVNSDAVQLGIDDPASGGTCLITLFKSLPGSRNAKFNFESAWDTIVKKTVSVSGKPQMQQPMSENGWSAESGLAPYEASGRKGLVLLVTLSGQNKMVNILILTNTDKFQQAITDFLESVELPKINAVALPENTQPSALDAASASAILGTWGQNLGAHTTYGDPVSVGMAGYSKDQYTFKANGTYIFVSKTFRMAYDKILLVRENGIYEINSETLTIKPQKSVIQAWSKLNGGDGFGSMLSSQNRILEPVIYRFTKHYFSGIDQWNLVLQHDNPTERDGPHSTFTLFPHAWYYQPISSNNPVIELPR